jgi:hypothetical protein
MLNEGNQIHNFMCVCENFCDTVPFYYGSDSNFLTTSYGSGSTQQKVTVPTVLIQTF